jgi:serine/threonine protein kinase
MQRPVRLWIMVRADSSRLLVEITGKMVQEGQGRGSYQAERQIQGARRKSRILDILGRGGFSKVYRVRDEVEDEERALKLFDNAAGYAAVRREIGALRKIRHSNVVEVYWAGRTSAGDWYLITEFIEGEPLTTWCAIEVGTCWPGGLPDW